MTTIDSCPVYLFKSSGFAPSGDTVVSVAPLDSVISVYGGGGMMGEGGLSLSFGGAVVFKNNETGQCFIGVWGARNASRFRRELRAQIKIEIVREAPNAQLAFRRSDDDRPKTTSREGKTSG